MLRMAGRWLVRFLSKPRAGYASPATVDGSRLAATLRQGDVLLVEGNSRFSEAIKYLTCSPRVILIFRRISRSSRRHLNRGSITASWRGRMMRPRRGRRNWRCPVPRCRRMSAARITTATITRGRLNHESE